MATDGARLEALGRLAKLLSDDDSVAGEVALARNEPARYVAEYAARLSDRGIDAPIPDLAFIALIDALQARKRCIEIDWKVWPREMVSAVRAPSCDASRRRAGKPRGSTTVRSSPTSSASSARASRRRAFRSAP